MSTVIESEPAGVPAIATELQCLQRQRAVYMKSRIMQANRLQALVAGTIGYHSGMKEADRIKMFAQSATLINQIAAGEVTSNARAIVMTHKVGIEELERMQRELEKSMVKMAKTLPVAAWVERPEQRGFGMLFLAIVIGETGDLANYANPAKVWRRLGCAPWTKNGETLMGATWKSRGKSKTFTKLTAEEWEGMGYNPRRRSIAYLIGEGLMKQNGSIRTDDSTSVTEHTTVGPYRTRYVEAKVRIYQTHPEVVHRQWEWKPCDKCKEADGVCGTCGGTGVKCQRAHLHGMLLATKLLLKELWIEWNK